MTGLVKRLRWWREIITSKTLSEKKYQSLSLKPQVTNLLNRVSGQKKRLMEVIELELELAESQLASRMSRKKEYKAKVIEITQANERKWLLKQGKGDCLDFKDE